MINGYRLLLSIDGDVSPDDFLESILLLLPAGLRSKISIAVGTLDEYYCDWAQLLIKTNNSIAENRLPKQLILVNRRIQNTDRTI